MLQNLFSNLRELDLTCKQHFLKSDSELASISIGAGVPLTLLMLYLDYYYYGMSQDFVATIGFSLVFAIISLIIVFGLMRSKQVVRYEQLVFTWTFFTAISAVLIIFSQTNRLKENLLFSMLFLIATYVIIPNRLSYRLIPTGSLTASCLIALLVNTTVVTFPDRYMFIMVLLTITGGGLLVLASTNRLKRDVFHAYCRDQEAHEKYARLAAVDEVTGVPNRRIFFERGQAALAAYHRYGDTFCLVMVDIDDFKKVNDQFGHLAGDEALRQLSSISTAQIRTSDFFARLGGDEFGFILNKTGQDCNLMTIDRIRLHLREVKITSPYGEFQVTFSGGVTAVRPEDQSLDALLARADQARYRAKDQGRDRVELG